MPKFADTKPEDERAVLSAFAPNEIGGVLLCPLIEGRCNSDFVRSVIVLNRLPESGPSPIRRRWWSLANHPRNQRPQRRVTLTDILLDLNSEDFCEAHLLIQEL